MSSFKNVLIIGKVWPEPKSSAAGRRMMQLIDFFLSQNSKITFATAASETGFQNNLNQTKVECVKIELNNDSFDSFMEELQPQMVIFDRFTMEEQFAWRVSKIVPSAVRIINTEDLHFLRDAREQSVKKNLALDESMIRTEMAMRELAAIQRSDLSLFVSEYEVELLQENYSVPPNRMAYLPLFASKNDEISSFENREGFMFIGNFYHAPNWDAVQILKKEIWPLIRKELPQATLSIYGAYAGKKVLDFHNEKEGFLVKGRVEDAKKVTQLARISLVPLRFGAGIKGKIIEAMENGTPTITTSVGSESMYSKSGFGGCIEDDFKQFSQKAVLLYTDKEKWLQAQKTGFEILSERFSKDEFYEKLRTTLDDLALNYSEIRKNDLQFNLLNHHSLESSMYLSKWIAEKNKTTL